MDADAVRGLLVDIDGVLTVSWSALPGAARAWRGLRRAGVPVRLLTNTTSRTRADMVARLRESGFEVAAGDVLTAGAAAASLVRERFPGARCWLLNSGDIAADLEGVRLVPPETDPADVDVVLIGGAGPEFTYDALNRAFACLVAGARLVALQRSYTYRTASGLALDAGAYLGGLERAAGVQALVTGKPAPAMFEAGLRSLGLPASQVAMVGDDVETDVRAAQALGIGGVQVRTGKFREGQLGRGEPPDVLLDSFAAVPRWLGVAGGGER